MKNVCSKELKIFISTFVYIECSSLFWKFETETSFYHSSFEMPQITFRDRATSINHTLTAGTDRAW